MLAVENAGAALEADVRRRIAAVQRLMDEHGVTALLAVGTGAPDGLGAIRYLAKGRAWAGPIYAMLAAAEAKPWLISPSSYQARWAAVATTTGPDRVITGADPIAETARLLRSSARPGTAVGIVNLARTTEAERQGFARALEPHVLVDLTDPFDALRRRKSPFEVPALVANGALLSAAMDVFAAEARIIGRGRGVPAAPGGLLGPCQAGARGRALHRAATARTVDPVRRRCHLRVRLLDRADDLVRLRPLSAGRDDVERRPSGGLRGRSCCRQARRDATHGCRSRQDGTGREGLRARRQAHARL